MFRRSDRIATECVRTGFELLTARSAFTHMEPSAPRIVKRCHSAARHAVEGETLYVRVAEPSRSTRGADGRIASRFSRLRCPGSTAPDQPARIEVALAAAAVCEGPHSQRFFQCWKRGPRRLATGKRLAHVGRMTKRNVTSGTQVSGSLARRKANWWTIGVQITSTPRRAGGAS